MDDYVPKYYISIVHGDRPMATGVNDFEYKTYLDDITFEVKKLNENFEALGLKFKAFVRTV
jgi:hypothetical protein